MYVHHIQLEKRPRGATIVSAEGDLPFGSQITPGCCVTLQYREVRIVAHVVEQEQDLFYVGQVLDLDGTLEPEIQGVYIGAYLRFREEHIFTCSQN